MKIRKLIKNIWYKLTYRKLCEDCFWFFSIGIDRDMDNFNHGNFCVKDQKILEFHDGKKVNNEDRIYLKFKGV